MGINWNNVIRDQARGLDPVRAYYKEKQRSRDAARREDEKCRAETSRSRMERRKR